MWALPNLRSFLDTVYLYGIFYLEKQCLNCDSPRPDPAWPNHPEKYQNSSLQQNFLENGGRPQFLLEMEHNIMFF